MSEEPVVALLISNSVGVRRAVRDALAPSKVRARGCGPRSLPHTADAVVTTAALNSQVERLAARVGTWQVFVLPEAVEALCDFVAARPDTVLVGADIASQDRLAKADMNPHSMQQEVLL